MNEESNKKINFKTSRNNPFWDFIVANYFLLVGLVLASGLIYLILHYDLSQGNRIPGVTEARGFTINFKDSVVVDEILVESGQLVSKGDPLFRLKREDLASRQYANETELQTALMELNIHSGRRWDKDKWVVFLEKRKKNQSLSPLEMRFLTFVENKKALASEEKSLEVVSPIDGLAGELQVSASETIPPFQPLLEIFHLKPTLVRSYIPESFSFASLTQNRASNIKSISRDYQVKGEIVSIGSMLTELPERFQKDPSMRIYGREIKVSLPQGNDFSLGEKVMVSFEGNQ